MATADVCSPGAARRRPTGNLYPVAWRIDCSSSKNMWPRGFFVAGCRVTSACALISMTVAARTAHATEVTVGGAYWRPSPSGTMTITEGARAGSGGKVDLSDDLDLGAGDVGEGSLRGAVGRHRLYISYDPLDFGGTTTPQRAFSFHGATFPAGTQVRSDVGLRLVVPRYDYALIDGSGGKLRGGLQAYVWTFDARLRGSSSGQILDEERHFTHVLPALVLAGEVPLGGFELAADGAFGAIGGERYAVDFTPRVSCTLWSRWHLAIGYRWLKFAFHETTNRADMTAQGPFVSIALDLVSVDM
jgi:hypothetical protein